MSVLKPLSYQNTFDNRYNLRILLLLCWSYINSITSQSNELNVSVAFSVIDGHFCAFFAFFSRTQIQRFISRIQMTAISDEKTLLALLERISADLRWNTLLSEACKASRRHHNRSGWRMSVSISTNAVKWQFSVNCDKSGLQRRQIAFRWLHFQNLC